MIFLTVLASLGGSAWAIHSFMEEDFFNGAFASIHFFRVHMEEITFKGSLLISPLQLKPFVSWIHPHILYLFLSQLEWQSVILWRMLYLFWQKNLQSSIVWLLFRYYNYFLEYSQPSILSTILRIFLALKLSAIQFDQRIEAGLFSEQHRLDRNEYSHLKQLLFHRNIFFQGIKLSGSATSF